MKSKIRSIKITIYISSILILMSCNRSTKVIGSDQYKNKEKLNDTVLVKIEDRIDKPLINFYTKSYSYYWVTEKDTLDFKIGMTELVRDSSVHIRFTHEKPILFSTAMNKLNECLSLIEQDFNMDLLKSLYFKPPIFYKDLTTELSKKYQYQFSNKRIKYPKLNEFLLDSSWLEQKVSEFLKQHNKSTKRYIIEKFHLLEKQYYGNYLPNTDLNEYPLFSIHGMGMSIILNDK
ncbi:hypothetical protein N9D29_03420 [Flavobacteriaceae bacterium]|nr:hypothetical protein [Flavobacteriaceae bacterium]